MFRLFFFCAKKNSSKKNKNKSEKKIKSKSKDYQESSSSQELPVISAWTDEDKAIIEKATSLASNNSISIHHYNESVDDIIETLDQNLLDVSSKVSLLVLGRNSPDQEGLGKHAQKVLNKDWFDVLVVEAAKPISEEEEQIQNKENPQQV